MLNVICKPGSLVQGGVVGKIRLLQVDGTSISALGEEVRLKGGRKSVLIAKRASVPARWPSFVRTEVQSVALA